MDYTHPTLTEKQAANCKTTYARLLQASRIRRQFVAELRKTGWEGHVDELWAAYLRTNGFPV